MPGDVDLVVAHATIEIGKLRFVGFLLRGEKVRMDPLFLHAKELALEPLPAAHVVVAHREAGGQEQTDTGEGEDEVQPSNRVVVWDRFLGLQSLSVVRCPLSVVSPPLRQRSTENGQLI